MLPYNLFNMILKVFSMEYQYNKIFYKHIVQKICLSVLVFKLDFQWNIGLNNKIKLFLVSCTNYLNVLSCKIFEQHAWQNV